MMTTRPFDLGLESLTAFWAQPGKAMLDAQDDEALALPGGHARVFVGGKSQSLFAPAVAAFVARHDDQRERAPIG